MTMTTTSKALAIVQCSLGDTGVPTPLRTVRRRRDLSSVLLRIAAHAKMPPRCTRTPHDLALDIRDCDMETLRAALARLSDRFQIVAIIPPIGVSSKHLQLGQTIAGLSDQLTLPGFSEAAFVTARNRYLTRCHWQNAGLPTSAFSLVQFPSALDPAIASIGLPARLSPLHYGLQHLEAHVQRDTEKTKAYQLVARTLQRYALTHPAPDLYSGEDPRTRHHIRFSFSTDQLAAAMPPGITVEFTLLIRNGIPKTISATPITERRGGAQPVVNRAIIAKTASLAIEGCVALGIRTGIVCCLIRHAADGDFLDGVIPNYIDARVIPMIEEDCGMSWPEVVAQSIGLD